MDGIYDTKNFPFEKLSLTPPTALSGGNYFIKYSMNGSPLYIQSPQCKTKGGISKSGKRMHCDLMFTNENPDFIKWMEDLETFSCKSIFEHRETWFETEMDLADIENYFASPLKIYKSGKYYLARTNIHLRLGKMSLKIYNENEEDVDPETIGENTQIITIMEIQGIKCSARSFQIEIELKQMMVLQPQDLFEKCILGKGKTMDASSISDTASKNVHLSSGIYEMNEEKEERHIDPILSENDPVVEEKAEVVPSLEEISQTNTLEENIGGSNLTDATDPLLTDPLLTDPLLIDPLLTDPLLTEYEFHLDLDKVTEEETIQIKARNEVYYNMYRDAKKKAKEARNIALAAYLEAKQIKQTYSLDTDTSDEDDDDDDEHDVIDAEMNLLSNIN